MFREGRFWDARTHSGYSAFFVLGDFWELKTVKSDGTSRQKSIPERVRKNDGQERQNDEPWSAQWLKRRSGLVGEGCDLAPKGTYK